jgi:hypothetical protein
MLSHRIATVAILLLAGCHHNDGRIVITGTASNLKLATAGTIGGERPCANAVAVTPLTSEDADPVWQVIGVSPATCATAMRYGASSPDFAVQVPALPLRAGI